MILFKRVECHNNITLYHCTAAGFLEEHTTKLLNNEKRGQGKRRIHIPFFHFP